MSKTSPCEAGQVGRVGLCPQLRGGKFRSRRRRGGQDCERRILRKVNLARWTPSNELCQQQPGGRLLRRNGRAGQSWRHSRRRPRSLSEQKEKRAGGYSRSCRFFANTKSALPRALV